MASFSAFATRVSNARRVLFSRATREDGTMSRRIAVRALALLS